jgi:hypothetical protein
MIFLQQSILIEMVQMFSSLLNQKVHPRLLKVLSWNRLNPFHIVTPYSVISILITSFYQTFSRVFCSSFVNLYHWPTIYPVSRTKKKIKFNALKRKLWKFKSHSWIKRTRIFQNQMKSLLCLVFFFLHSLHICRIAYHWYQVPLDPR